MMSAIVTRLLLPALVLFSTAALAAPRVHFGIVKLDGDGQAIVVTDATPAPTDTIHLQYPDAQSQPRCCKQLRGSDLAPAEANTVVAANKIGDGAPVVLQARVPADWADMPFIGATTFGTVSRVLNVKDKLVAVDARGVRHQADLCVSTEGVHLTETWRGATTTHLYLWLGYDVESPTCH